MLNKPVITRSGIKSVLGLKFLKDEEEDKEDNKNEDD